MAQSLKYSKLAPASAPTREVAPAVTPISRDRVANVTVGKGLVTPLRRDGKGDFANTNDVSLVRSHVRQVLNTLCASGISKGEIPWRPEFGCLLQLLRYRNLDETTIELARTYVVSALQTWLPRIRVTTVDVTADQDNTALLIRVRYDVLSRTAPTAIATGQTVSTRLAVAA